MPEITQRLTAALVGRYRLERHLGEGGMATVYLAHDEKHDRKVALKVLKPELAAILGGERFLNEIKVTANLQHPNILPLYDSGAADGFLYYVMPFVEGESLRDWMDRERQLPVEPTIDLAVAVCGALQYAHEQGVVHRDIKPENILLQRGQPLVADFGIALAVSQAGGTRLTETGLSLGTPHYMSPEQAMGDREIDARSDVYSLGAMVYEMLAGEPPHLGNSLQAVIAKILSERPMPLAKSRDLLPPNVDAAVQRALAKSPADRFARAADFGAALKNPGYALPSMAATAPVPATARGRQRRPGATAIVAGVAILAALAGWLRPRGEPPRPVVRYSMALPVSEQLGFERGSRVAIAPDGSRMVYIGASQAGVQLWVRRRDQLTAQLVPSTVGVSHVFFSPDGTRIGYLASEPASTIRVATLGGGPPLLVTDSAVGLDGATWSADGYLYFDGITAGGTTGLVRIRPGGGPQEIVTVVDTAAGESDHIWPEALPDGKGILFTVGRGQDLGEADIGVLPPGGGPHRVLVRGLGARYAESGHLLYVTADGMLMAAPFDLDNLRLTGEAVGLTEGIAVRPFGAVDVTVSREGTMMFVVGSQVTEPGEVVRVTRAGEVTPLDAAWKGDFRTLAVSPDGRQLAVSIVQGSEQQVWVKQLPRGPLSKLTFEGTTAYRPAWTADGRSVGFVSNARGGVLSLFVKRADGSDMARWLPGDSARSVGEVVWSRDGQWMVYQLAGSGYWARRTSGDTVPRHLTTASQGTSFGAALSPDSRWLAYSSNESGQVEVYVRPFPNTEEAKWQVSTRSGSMPLWSPTGRELYYQDIADSLAAVEILPGTTFSMGERRLLFPNTGFRRSLRAYDVLPDGSFAMIRQNLGADASYELIVVENAFAELRDRLPR
jgi:eukaryotic-like serine/threonine-protein kinase